MRSLILLSGLLLTAASGCIAYNVQCEGLVENPKERIGFIAEDVYLDKPNARHANNAIGQMTADGFVEAFADGSDPASFAIINGGAIRAEGICVTRNALKKGSEMTNGLLHEILLFENVVMAVDLTEEEVVQMLEHSVSRLVPNTQPITSPSGQFLHVSREVAMKVNCTRPAGSRIYDLKLNGVQVLPGTPRKERYYRVAMASYILGGGDGYSMLAGKGSDPERKPAQAQRFGGIDSNLSAEYMRKHYNQSAASGLTVDRARIELGACAVPDKPQG
ncbi:MAG: 5'-nucleotidase C-terminal domain-containing protein [Myxococcales bacterium]|nr:5'-nucleotidase C-terminal domain-containing protein [Myxococcales bacterium]